MIQLGKLSGRIFTNLNLNTTMSIYNDDTETAPEGTPETALEGESGGGENTEAGEGK